MKTWIAMVVTAFVSGGAALFWVGAYDISATDQHLAPTYWLLDIGMRRSVRARAASIAVPKLDDASMQAEGLRLFRDHCVQCHGAPGVPPAPFALGMTPVPANLVHTAREWAPAEIYWTVREGIKMTGMPAWRYRLADRQLWSIVAFMRERLPGLSPQEYASAAGAAGTPSTPEEAALQAASADRGRRAIQQYACVTCHRIPGIVGSNAPVGPPLTGMGSREFIAGVLPASTDNLVWWLRAPHLVSERNAMPDLGVTEQDARDMAAYLMTLR
jgi:mono/diheme cytochrome c family protein